MSQKSQIARKIKRALKQGKSEPARGSRIVRTPDNIEQALFRDIDGEADDLWHKAMLELNPRLAPAQPNNLFDEV